MASILAEDIMLETGQTCCSVFCRFLCDRVTIAPLSDLVTFTTEDLIEGMLVPLNYRSKLRIYEMLSWLVAFGILDVTQDDQFQISGLKAKSLWKTIMERTVHLGRLTGRKSPFGPA